MCTHAGGREVGFVLLTHTLTRPVIKNLSKDLSHRKGELKSRIICLEKTYSGQKLSDLQVLGGEVLVVGERVAGNTTPAILSHKKN